MKRAKVLLFAMTGALFCIGLAPTRVAGQDPPVESAPSKKPRIFFTSPRVVAYQLRRLSAGELVLVDRNTSDQKYRPVYEALLSRPGLGPQFRSEALQGLSALNKTDRVAELIAGIGRLDQSDGEQTSVLGELALRLTTASPRDLQPKRDGLEEVASSARRPLTRRAAFAAVVIADGGWDRAWAAAAQRQDGLIDLIGALPMIPAPRLRGAFYGKIEPLLKRAPGKHVRNAAIEGISHIPGHDAETFTILAEAIRSDRGRRAAILSIRRTDKTAWPAEGIGPLAESLLAYAGSVPASDRASEVFLEAMALGNELADRLPEDRAVSLRKELGSMGVSVFLIKTIPHQMLYDRTKIEVQAGKPVLVIFENHDSMTHNLLITTPGAHQEVGTAAEAMAAQPGALAKGYVPDSKKILWATKLLQPGEKQKLSFNAPQRPGVYPYFCTYPGHWRRMFGAMYVVADLEEYRTDPEAYLSKHPLPIVDELLKNDRPNRQWKFEELAPSVEGLSQGRSFVKARQVFQAANCVACHRLNGVGYEIGPDLTKLDPELGPSDILQELLDPSKKINEDFQAYTFLLESGVTVTGLIVEETADVVKVARDPSAESEPTVLKKAEIEVQVKSDVSIMPIGLLNNLTRDEILDLVAYVISRGDRNSKLFHGKHRHE